MHHSGNHVLRSETPRLHVLCFTYCITLRTMYHIVGNCTHIFLYVLGTKSEYQMRKIGKKKGSLTAVLLHLSALKITTYVLYQYNRLPVFTSYIFQGKNYFICFYSCKYDTLMQWHAAGKGAHPPSGDIFKPEIKANSSDIYEDLRTHQFPTWLSKI